MNFNFDDLQRELDVTESYLNANDLESQTVLRRSLPNVRASKERFGISTNETISQPQVPPVSKDGASMSTTPNLVGVDDFPHPDAHHFSNNRYTNPADREALILRLLSDYHSRKDKIAFVADDSKTSNISTTNPRKENQEADSVDATSKIKFSSIRQDTSPLPPLYPQSRNYHAEHQISRRYQPQNDNNYSPDSFDVQSTPSFYNGSSVNSSPQDPDASPGSNQGSGKNDETLFYASDLYGGDHDISSAYMGGGEELFERMQSSAFDRNNSSVGIKMTSSKQSFEFDKNFQPETTAKQIGKTIQFTSSDIDKPEIGNASSSSTLFRDNKLSETVKFIRESQPWERAMPDYRFPDKQVQPIESADHSYEAGNSEKAPTHAMNDINLSDDQNERVVKPFKILAAEGNPPVEYNMSQEYSSKVFIDQSTSQNRRTAIPVASEGSTAGSAPLITDHNPRRSMEAAKRKHRMAMSMSPSKPRTPQTRKTSRSRSFSAERMYLKSKDQIQQAMEEEFRKKHPFTPRLSRNHTLQSNSRQRSRDLSQRIKEMQEEHKKKIEARERQRQEYEKVDMLECTFRPALSKATEKIVKAKEQQQSSDNYGDDSSACNNSLDISKRLHNDAAHRMYYHHWLGQELEKIKLANYTFAPVINSNTDMILEDGGVDVRPIHERVVELQRQHRQRMQAIRNMVEKEQVDLTFHPQLVDHSRVLAERRWMRDHGIEFSATGNVSGTEEALRILYHRDEKQNVATRLMNEGRRIAKRKQLLLHEREQALADELEQPVVGKGSKKLIEKSDFARADFETRQQLHESRVNRRFDERVRIDEEMFKSWFRPEVTRKSHHILSEKRPNILKEDIGQKSNRMAYEEMDKIERHRKVLEKNIYQQLTFKPVLDPISKLFGRKSTVQELHENPRGKQRAEEIRQKLEEEMNEACTFSPEISKRSRQLAEPDEYEQLYLSYQNELQQRGYMENDVNVINQSQGTSHNMGGNRKMPRINMKEPEKMIEDFKMNALQKEEARRNDLILREMKELEECTFQPSIYSYPPSTDQSNKRPIVVKGLARHMELRRLANKMKGDAAQREFEVFHVANVDKYRRPEDGLTVCEPFEFNALPSQRRNSAKSHSN